MQRKKSNHLLLPTSAQTTAIIPRQKPDVSNANAKYCAGKTMHKGKVIAVCGVTEPGGSGGSNSGKP